MRTLPCRLALLGAASVLAAAAAQAAVPRYRVEFSPPAGNHNAYSINNAGVVAGSVPDGSNSGRPFLYDDGRFSPVPGVRGHPVELNDRGTMLGTLLTSDAPALYRAFVYDAQGRVSIVPTPGGGRYSWGLSLNNAGHVVGYAAPWIYGTTRLFFYDGMRSRFLDLSGGGQYWSAFLNDADQILVRRYDAAGNSQAVLWDQGTTTTLSLPEAVPGGGPRGWLTPVDLDEAGRALVRYERRDGSGFSGSYVWDAGRYSQVGPDGFQAEAMNEQGWVVGEMPGDRPGATEAGLYADGRFHALGALMPRRYQDVNFTSALGINDRGQIIGYSDHGGFYLATPAPVPEAATLATLLAGWGGVAAAVRCRRRRQN